MYFADISGHYQPTSITFFLKILQRNAKELKKPHKHDVIGSNYTISQSIKFGVNFKIGTGCLFSREANCDRVRFWTCRRHTPTHFQGEYPSPLQGLGQRRPCIALVIESCSLGHWGTEAWIQTHLLGYIAMLGLYILVQESSILSVFIGFNVYI